MIVYRALTRLRKVRDSVVRLLRCIVSSRWKQYDWESLELLMSGVYDQMRLGRRLEYNCLREAVMGCKLDPPTVTRLERLARALLEVNPTLLGNETITESFVAWKEDNSYLGTRCGYHLVLNREHGRLYYLDDGAYLLCQLCRKPTQPSQVCKAVIELFPDLDPRYLLVGTYAALSRLHSEGLLTESCTTSCV